MQPISTSFDPDRFYRGDDPEMRIIATAGTLARWRCEGRGPAYSKSGYGQGARILYQGIDILAFLAERKTVPDGAPIKSRRPALVSEALARGAIT